MALTGGSMTHRFQVVWGSPQDDPGVQFKALIQQPVELKPIRIGTLWHVPVITGWEVQNKFTWKSYSGQFDIEALGGYEQRYMLTSRPFEDADFETDGGAIIYVEVGEEVGWGAGTEYEGTVPPLESNWTEDDMAIWVVKQLWFIASIKQDHEVPETQAGYYPPAGTTLVDITYHWRNVSVADFEKLKARM